MHFARDQNAAIGKRENAFLRVPTLAPAQAIENENRGAEMRAAIHQHAGIGAIIKPQSFGATIADYLGAKRATMRPRTYADNKRYLEILWKPLHRLPLGSVARANVAAELRKIANDSGPVTANRARSALSAS